MRLRLSKGPGCGRWTLPASNGLPASNTDATGGSGNANPQPGILSPMFRTAAHEAQRGKLHSLTELPIRIEYANVLNHLPVRIRPLNFFYPHHTFRCFRALSYKWRGKPPCF